MRSMTFAAALAAVTLAGCGLNGTDRDKDDAQPAAQTAEAAPAAEPDFAALEHQDIADPEARPQMQLQVVLDQQGFGPGVIDGKEGLSTANALKGLQEANGLDVTGTLDDATRQVLARWDSVPATQVIRIPESWGEIAYMKTPGEPADQAKLDRLEYQTLDEKLAERFHTTVAVLQALNPGGRPAGAAAPAAAASASPTPSPTSTAPAGTASDAPPKTIFAAGQQVRVPNVGLDAPAASDGSDRGWSKSLAALGVTADQPKVARIVVDKSEGWLKGYDADDKLVALFTVTTGSSHDPLPLGDWKILGTSRNPPFHYNPDLFWDAEASDEKATIPPGPNGPVGVAWIDLSKEHYGIHGTAEPQSIGRAQSHGCVRLTNWDVARLAQMVDTRTAVKFQA